MTYRVLSLFAGIGGFDMGMERTGGFRTVTFGEIEPFAVRVLNKHWPGVPVYGDVRELTGEVLKRDGISVDVICGGFPCQDLSLAGRQGGITARRSGLWSEICRLACEIRPRFVLVENVANLLAGPDERPGAWFGRVLGDLAEIGFNAEWHCIPASSIGAPHLRDRVFIVAYPDSERLSFGEIIASLAAESFVHARTRREWQARSVAEPGIQRVADGFPDQVDLDRLKACGNSIVPQIPELIDRAILAAQSPQSES